MTRSGAAPRRVDLIALVFAGGCVGGYARYAVTQAWTGSPDGFPWSTFAVNIVGAFVLALLVVVVSDIRPGRYLRPLLGTGFCGALTTFSSVVVAVDELFAHGHVGTALAYLGGTTVAAFAATVAGLAIGRSAVARLRADR